VSQTYDCNEEVAVRLGLTQSKTLGLLPTALIWEILASLIPKVIPRPPDFLTDSGFSGCLKTQPEDPVEHKLIAGEKWS
jgi:hypothetical protein